ncbi:NAD-dependent succinate-semialdehyde dehydrogenase [Plantactinospora sp. KBS50]|uniref:NAD-dependent succinate-semialdehyde dehydrogenase n=1 Tax=Plantactinospora sp. KBS50 TaxID=2024580 RepID=UPI000BAB2087|nr:NAD-dependent succinate-semialdehyde dehydrogenase [Plantactinospora sp. KBS50]ASW57779.1 NAD-dependent succinate-semialdehyde dehydrogenase [Plantactinospora sp. KBS50]
MNPTTVHTSFAELRDRLLPDAATGSGGPLDVLDPATGEVLTSLAAATAADAGAAVDTAAGALRSWAATPSRQRADILHRAYALMTERGGELATLISLENGKSRPDALAEVAYAADFLRWSAEEAVRSDGDFTPAPAGGTRAIVTHRPIGVAALVTPWNFPAAMITRKVGPALAAGCTAVLKPASETPLTALALARVLRDAGLPPAALVVTPTLDAGAVVGAWLADDRVRKLSFTGSTAVGRRLLAQAADRIVNTSMELGGNAPFVVAPDADLPAAVAGAMIAKFRNGGQACTAANRFYLHVDVLEEFVRRFGAATAALTVGPAADPATQIGPLINERAVTEVDRLVRDALARGARISHRAEAPRTGCFYPPTVLRDVPADAQVVTTEIFGPVAPVVAWRDEDELLAMLNGTEFGLAGYVYSGDLRWALRLAESTEAGMVGINRGVVSDAAFPFGGMKQSGLGREGGREGLRAYQETQYLSVQWD